MYGVVVLLFSRPASHRMPIQTPPRHRIPDRRPTESLDAFPCLQGGLSAQLLPQRARAPGGDEGGRVSPAARLAASGRVGDGAPRCPSARRDWRARLKQETLVGKGVANQARAWMPDWLSHEGTA